MAEVREFDVVVVGAGPAGEVCAGRVADGGLSVALVEQELIGGECSFYACMPSKALLRPAQALAEARRVPGAAEAATGELDVAAVLRRRDEVIHDLDDSSHMPWLEDRSITLLRGHASLVGERAVKIGEELLHARRAIVLAPGSAAAIPPIPGLAEADPWTNREVTTAAAIPSSLIVLGGGVVGVEMAQAYASLGASVTIVEAREFLLAGEEEFASEQVRDALVADGVEVILTVKATAVRRDHVEGVRGPVTVELEDGRSLVGAELLAAVGRRPRTDELGLESIGLAPGEPVEVDATLRVPGYDWLYVVGDANGRVLLTHMGKYQARVAAEHILGRPGGDAMLHSDGRLAPRVIFTEPQIAAVGHTLASATQAGLNVRAVDQPVGGNAGGSFVGHDAPGSVRLIVDEDRRVLVGATFTGVEVAESLHAATIAVIGEVPLERLWHAVPCFPTRSEVWLRLLEAYGL
ncbi:MAG TPA: NAD(P)/FAD-dependent oxidoreductase [Solirubrobacteraceae bacterium]|nr:NAD(P)/FAD-dependent oxidoreductase [Solirubrobacteraceae bacterium]